MEKNSNFIVIFLVLTSLVLLYACNKKNDDDIQRFRNFYTCVKDSVIDADNIENAEKTCGEMYYSQEEPPEYNQY